MIPPTPTPLPPGIPQFAIPSGYSLWASTNTAIQMWNWIGTAGTVVQAISITGLVILGIYVLMRFARDFTKKDSEE